MKLAVIDDIFIIHLEGGLIFIVCFKIWSGLFKLICAK